MRGSTIYIQGLVHYNYQYLTPLHGLLDLKSFRKLRIPVREILNQAPKSGRGKKKKESASCFEEEPKELN